MMDKVKRLETLITTAPQKRMRTDPSGSQTTEHPDLAEIIEQFAFFQDQLTVNNDIQEELTGQVRQLEAEMKNVQVTYPSFEGVEARIKQHQQDTTYNMNIMKEAFERHMEKWESQ